MATLKNTTINDTGYLEIPSGTIAQRPTSPTEGMMRYNTDLKVNEYYDGSKWVLGSSIPPIVSNGLILNLDAADPNSYPGSGTTWTDLSGNSNNFTLVNSPTYNSNGWFSFDGVDEYANIGSSTTLNLAPSNNRTIEIWGRVNSISSLGGLFGDQNATSGVLMVTDTGRFLWRWDDSSSSSEYLSQKQLSEGEWFQCVVVLRNSYYVTYYVNGTLDTSEFRTTDTAASSNFSWSIARQNRDFSGNFLYLDCDVSNAKQYNRILSAQEIQQNFNALRSRFSI